MNAGKNHWATGAYLATMAPLYPCMRVIPTTTESGFTKDVAMRRNADNNAWITDGLGKHLHAHNTDADGGLLVDMERPNMGNLLRWLGNTYKASDFFIDKSGTLADATDEISGSIGRIKIEAGTTLNGYANIRKFGVTIDFNNPSAFETRLEHNGATTNYLWRAGISAEMINLANDTTQQSYGLEACSASGANILIYSCSPPVRSTVSSGYAIDTTSHTWYVVCDPTTPNIVVTRDADFANSVTKTSDIPITGNGQSACLFGAGIKTTLGSETKIIRYTGTVVMGRYGTTGWKWLAS